MTKGFKIIGISTRTTNKDNRSSEDLGGLWEKFYARNVFDKIPNKVSDDIFCIYTDYKSDYTEDYTAILGVPVSTISEIPDGFIGREFEPEYFTKFTAKGDLPNSVVTIWSEIWKADESLQRKYTYDFEVYGEKSQKGKNSEVEIFIATPQPH
ncbi:MAG: AraC family transcriptional regulator [Flavobacterium sp.]|nr:MAG: AraC family transcriptional regulator [Flavobacterium sp.]